jgi:hypothetical protein
MNMMDWLFGPKRGSETRKSFPNERNLAHLRDILYPGFRALQGKYRLSDASVEMTVDFFTDSILIGSETLVTRKELNSGITTSDICERIKKMCEKAAESEEKT